MDSDQEVDGLEVALSIMHCRSWPGPRHLALVCAGVCVSEEVATGRQWWAAILEWLQGIPGVRLRPASPRDGTTVLGGGDQMSA